MGSVVHEKMKHRTKLTQLLHFVLSPSPVLATTMSPAKFCRAVPYVDTPTLHLRLEEYVGVECGPVALRYARCSPGPSTLEVGRATAATHQCTTTHRRRAASASSTTRRRRRVSKASLARHGRASPAKPKHGRAEDIQAAANYHRTAMFCEHSSPFAS